MYCRVTEGLSWKEHFKQFYVDFGRYKHYREIKTAWGQIEDFCEEYCPSIYLSLQGTHVCWFFFLHTIFYAV